eukprot:sb/3472799/
MPCGRMGAEEKVLAYLETMFHENAKDTDNINYEEFKTVVRCKQEYFTQRMFEICDKDKSQSISLVEFTSNTGSPPSPLSPPEFTSTLGRLMKTSDNEEEKRRIMRDKLMFLFSIYDKDTQLCNVLSLQIKRLLSISIPRVPLLDALNRSQTAEASAILTT